MPAPAAIYARVSTEDQSTGMQVTALREAADRLRLDPVLVVVSLRRAAREAGVGSATLSRFLRTHAK